VIDGVVVKACTVHADDRGHLIEIIRDDEPVFREVKQRPTRSPIRAS
jgi:dTDP-4-dehydrorhamnose 3,5-epimerase-like enzyme